VCLIKKIIFLLILTSIFFIQNSFSKEKFLSLKKNTVNVRHGPTFDSPIKYIYKRMNLPVKQIDKKENFRRIIDLKNNSGWIHLSQLKPSNSIIILKNKILFKRSSKFSEPIARLEKGRLLIIKKCLKDWCNIKTQNFTGWIQTGDIWGSIN
jgi:SH3-like domain-containing protein